MKKILTLAMLFLWCLPIFAQATGEGSTYPGAIAWTQNKTCYSQDGTTISTFFWAGIYTSSAARDLIGADAAKIHVTKDGKDYVESVETGITDFNTTKKGLIIHCSNLEAGTYTLSIEANGVSFNQSSGYYYLNNAFSGTMTLTAASNGGGGGEDPGEEVTYSAVEFGSVAFPHYNQEDWTGYWGKGNATATPALVDVVEGAPACTLAGPNGAASFQTTPYVGGSDLAGKLVFQIADNSPAGDYTITIPQGYFTLGENEQNEETTVPFHYDGLPKQYADVSVADITFPYYGNNTYRGYWGDVTVATTPTMTSTTGQGTATLVNQQTGATVAFKSGQAPNIGTNYMAKGKLIFGIADDTPAGMYTLTIPQGYFLVSDNTYNNEIQCSFRYGPEPTTEFTFEPTGYTDGNNIQFTVSPDYNDNYSPSGLTCTLTDESGTTYTMPTQPTATFSPYLWVYLPAGLKEADRQTYTLHMPQGYLKDQQGNPNAAADIEFEWGTEPAPAPTPAEIPYIAVHALYTTGGQTIYSTSTDKAIDSFQLYFGEAENTNFTSVTRDNSKKVTVTDNKGGSYPSIYNGGETGYSLWVEGCYVNPTTPPTICTVTIPEGMFTWTGTDGVSHYNVEMTLPDAFSVGSNPPCATPVVTYADGTITFTTATPGATIVYNYSVRPADEWDCVLGDFNEWITVTPEMAADAENTVFTLDLDFTGLDGAFQLYAAAKATKEGLNVSGTGDLETTLNLVDPNKPAKAEAPVITVEGDAVTFHGPTSGYALSYQAWIEDEGGEVTEGDNVNYVVVEPADAESTVTVTINFPISEAEAYSTIHLVADSYSNQAVEATMTTTTLVLTKLAEPVLTFVGDALVAPSTNPDDNEPAAQAAAEIAPGSMVRQNGQITITNPNGMGYIVYSINDGEEMMSSDEEVTLTVPEKDAAGESTMGQDYNVRASVAVEGDDAAEYTASKATTATLKIAGATLRLEMEAEGSTVKVFTLDGHAVKAADLEPGLYIVIREGKATPTLVK